MYDKRLAHVILEKLLEVYPDQLHIKQLIAAFPELTAVPGRDWLVAVQALRLAGKLKGVFLPEEGTPDDAAALCITELGRRELRGSESVASIKPDGPTFLNLTPLQKDLLIELVDRHELHNGAPYMFAQSHSGSGLGPNGPPAPPNTDVSDFLQLQSERLLTVHTVGPNVIGGKPTQLGIETAATLRRSQPQQPVQEGEARRSGATTPNSPSQEQDLMYIIANKALVFLRDGYNGEQVTVRPGNGPQRVPGWVRESPTFQHAVKDGSVKEVEIKTPLPVPPSQHDESIYQSIPEAFQPKANAPPPPPMTDRQKGLAKARFLPLLNSPPCDWDETDIARFHQILSALEEAYGEDLSAFRIPEERLKDIPMYAQRQPRSGRAVARPPMAKSRYCPAEFARQQIEGVHFYLQVLDSGSKASSEPASIQSASPVPQPTPISTGPPRSIPGDRVETFLDASRPKFMYHATKDPVQVFSRKQIEDLGPEWSETYIFQAYPKCKYHRTGKTANVKDADAEKALGKGWGDSPGGPFGPPDADPLRWFDSWDLQCLSPDARGRIKEGLANAHADVIESSAEDGSRVRQSSAKKAFGVIAEEYLAAGLLTEAMMADSIPQKVYDAAVSGGWQTGALERNRGCTLQFGHYWVPPSVPQMLRDLFEAQVWRFRGKLDAKGVRQSPLAPAPEAGPANLPEIEGAEPKEPPLLPQAGDPKPDAIVAERAERRQAVVNPILAKKRWKAGRLVTESAVGKATVYGYLDGTRSWIDQNNRKAIAECLDLKPDELPD
jgi:hypothetical protein